MIESPCKLQKNHLVDDFDCGKESLNSFLKKFAYANQQANSSVTYVALFSEKVVGYYCVSYGSVLPSQAPDRIARGIGKYPIPIFLIGRLAVDQRFQGKGVGASLLQDAILRACNSAEQAGLRAIVVDAVDEKAKRFYLEYSFEPSVFDDSRLFLLLKDAKRTLGL